MNTRRDFLKLTTLGIPAFKVSNGFASKKNNFNKPNFLVIVADDMGFSDPRCYGGEIATPNLDTLSANGLKFTQFYSTGRCWPSRACILTGYYAQQVRMDPPKGNLPSWTRLIPHYLKPHGYQCYHSGKWHIFGAPMPVRHGGFDHSYRLDDQDRFFSPRKHWKNDQPLPPVSPESGFYATTAIADHAIQCLKEHNNKHLEKPFFHYLAFTSPHFPLHALQEDIDRYKDRYDVGWDAIRESRWKRMREMGIINCELPALEPEIKPSWNLSEKELQTQIGDGEEGEAIPWKKLTDEQKDFQSLKMAIHAAMIDRMDQEIGRVIEQLKAMGTYENTVILVVSDNGASAEQIIRGDMHDPTAVPGSWQSYLCLGPGWSTAANTPFRYHKSWVHEGGISSPLIIHWPAGLSAKGELRRNPGHFVDLLPTILELAEVKSPPIWKGNQTPPLAGKSLVPTFTADGSVSHEFIYFHHLDNKAIRVGDWKLVAAGKDAPWELYNLQTDRCEMNDLSAKHPEKVRELSQLWERKEYEFRQLAASDKKDEEQD